MKQSEFIRDRHVAAPAPLRTAVVIAPEAPATDPVLFRGPPEQVIRLAADIGYEAVEIHLQNPRTIDRDALAASAAAQGIALAAVATGMARRIEGLSFVDDDPSVRHRAVERIQEFIDFVQPFGAAIIIGSMRGTIPSFAQRGEYLRRFYICMEQVLETATVRNVTILLELINRYENNYFNRVEEALELIRPIDCQQLRFNLDTFHMNIEEPDVGAAIRMSRAKLGHVHLADNTRQSPGTGSFDFMTLFDALRTVGYSGFVSLECLSDGDAEAVAVSSLEQIKRWDRLSSEHRVSAAQDRGS